MRRTCVAVAGALVVGVLVAVASGSASSGTAQPIRVTLERHACFGACPTYTLTLRGDGSVVYVGGRHVAVTGTRRARLSRKAVARLRKRD